jgi:hypothetical protein
LDAIAQRIGKEGRLVQGMFERWSPREIVEEEEGWKEGRKEGRKVSPASGGVMNVVSVLGSTLSTDGNGKVFRQTHR